MFGWSLLGDSTARESSRHFATPRSLRNERKNSILMNRHHPDLGSASSVAPGEKFASTGQKHYPGGHHLYRISALVSQTSFRLKRSERLRHEILISLSGGSTVCDKFV